MLNNTIYHLNVPCTTIIATDDYKCLCNGCAVRTSLIFDLAAWMANDVNDPQIIQMIYKKQMIQMIYKKQTIQIIYKKETIQMHQPKSLMIQNK
jgi:predicted Fe-S protein YdhL (DUF1289 family)